MLSIMMKSKLSLSEMTIDGNENIDIKPSDGKVKSNDDKKNTDGTTDGSGDNKGEKST